VRINVAPIVIKAHLMGDMKTLKLWMTEGVYSRLAADIRARKADGIVIDANILAIDENTVIMRFIEGGGPVILVVYMVQQINCIRNKAGEIIEVFQCFWTIQP
jgi:mitochondrial import inner membrane translocase subunit TIM44